MEATDDLRRKYEDLHGFWSEDLDRALQAAPDFFADYLTMAEVALGSGHLDRKTRAFVMVAANAAVTHLNAEATEAWIGRALDDGATRQELLEVLQIASVLGIHSYTMGAPILLQELEASGDEALKSRFPRDERFNEVKREFSEKRGYWNDLLDDMVRSSPDFVMGYTAFSSTPWRNGVLAPMVKELLYVAIDISTTHLYEPGVRIHTRNALRYGATPEQVVQVIQLVACVGMQSYVMGVPLLSKQLDGARSA